MSSIDQKQANAFLASCEEGSIRAAAERLKMEPSSISRHISALEKSLSMTLVERGRRGITPTEAGRLLLDHLERQRSDFEAIQSGFDELRGMQRGELVVAVGDGFISDFIGNALSTFNGAFPGITYSLRSGSTEQVIHTVCTDQAHVGLAFNARHDRMIRVLAKVRQPLMVLVSPHSEFADLPATVSIDQLADLPCAMPLPSFGVGALIREVEAIHGLRFRAVVESNSLAVLRNFVREGLGVTILPSFVVTREIADGTIVAKGIGLAALNKGEASLFVRQGRRLPQGATRLAEHAMRGMMAFRPVPQ